MKKLLVGLIFVILFIGCDSQLSFTEVNMSLVNKDIKVFINAVEDENGIHLYNDGKKNMYIFLNGDNVNQGDKAAHFSDFNIEAEGDTLKVLLHHEYTDDYSIEDLNHQLLYKVKVDKKYDKIMLFDNNEETSFHTILN